MTVRGEYIAIEPPHLLEFTWLPSWEDFHPTTIRCELLPTETGTRLTLTHTGFGDCASMCEGHAEGWTRVMGWLAAHMRHS